MASNALRGHMFALRRSPATCLVGLLLLTSATLSAQPPHSHRHAEHSHGHSHGHPHSDDEPSAVVDAWSRTSLMLLCGGYGAAIAAASLLGGLLPGRRKLSHLQFQALISFVGGLMLGIATLHLFPHAIHEAGSGAVDRLCGALAIGILVMFFLLRAFHVHHHEADPMSPGSDHAHLRECGHVHPQPNAAAANSFGWVGLFIGLGLHTLLDGVALGIAMQAEGAHGAVAPGLGTLLAVAFHKPMDSLSITTLMIAGKWSGRSRLLVNLAFASLAPIGAAATLIGVSGLTESNGVWLAYGLAFSAGIFLSIALSDLLPEMQFHSHFRWQLTFALLLGMAVAWAIQFLEPSHLHAG